MLFVLLILSHLSLAVAQEITVTLVRQAPTVPPHAPSTDLTSLRAWQADKAKSLTKKITDGEVVRQNFAYHDTYGFRITGKRKLDAVRDRHLFLNGCSWTYGSGVESEATFAALLEEQLKTFRVVNMGARGGGLNEALYIWRNFFWDKVYPEERGILIYTLFSDHFERVTRTWRYLHWAPPFSPNFDKKLEHSFPSYQFWDFKVAKLIKGAHLDEWWLRLTSHFNAGNPQEFNAVVVRYLLAIKAEYLRRFPRGRFVVTWMNFINSPSFTEKETPAFLRALDDAGIEYWQPSPKLQHPLQDYTIPRDGHPSALANREHAEFLLGKIQAALAKDDTRKSATKDFISTSPEPF